MWTKMCPKCGGDFYVRQDIYGKEVICIQCGLILSPEQGAELLKKLLKEKERKRAAA
jgi:transcription initiation factor TFIIIB Brf1 subunit/transcription initiation factor TFIIB